MPTVIKVENVSKQYRLGLVNSGTLRDDVSRWWHKIRGKEDPLLTVGEANDRTAKGESNYVWSLRSINFEVNKGDVIGIIGRNGAGKSTLLKILSKVTSPTTGTIKTKGRIASLLEVGTGFHPELTGKENIYLNGAILGMRRSEITRKLDEIVAFAGIERYIDTPVKRYSSGMYVRLAFAVAAHLESEILVVDEVLAVGDSEFQKKCIGKMREISEGKGRTILFVSHNTAAVKKLCTKGIVLNNGEVAYSGLIDDALTFYSKYQNEGSTSNITSTTKREGNGNLVFSDFQILDTASKQRLKIISSGQDVTFRFTLERKRVSKFKSVLVGIGVNDSFGNRIAHLDNEFLDLNINEEKGFIKAIEFVLPRFSLNKGNYSMALMCKTNDEVSDWIQEGIKFEVDKGDFYSSGKIMDTTRGMFLMDYEMKTEHDEIL